MLSQPLIKCTYVLIQNKLTVHIKLFKYIKSTAYKKGEAPIETDISLKPSYNFNTIKGQFYIYFFNFTVSFIHNYSKISNEPNIGCSYISLMPSVQHQRLKVNLTNQMFFINHSLSSHISTVNVQWGGRQLRPKAFVLNTHFLYSILNTQPSTWSLKATQVAWDSLGLL